MYAYPVGKHIGQGAGRGVHVEVATAERCGTHLVIPDTRTLEHVVRVALELTQLQAEGHLRESARPDQLELGSLAVHIGDHSYSREKEREMITQIE